MRSLTGIDNIHKKRSRFRSNTLTNTRITGQRSITPQLTTGVMRFHGTARKETDSQIVCSQPNIESLLLEISIEFIN